MESVCSASQISSGSFVEIQKNSNTKIRKIFFIAKIDMMRIEKNYLEFQKITHMKFIELDFFIPIP